MNRRDFLSASVLGAALGATPQNLARAVQSAQVPNFTVSRQVEISVPDKAFEESFWIAARLVSDMRRLAFQYYGKDGWLAVSDGKVGPQHGYDPRDFRYGPKCAAYLYGDDPSFTREMGKRIFLDEIEGSDCHLAWGWKRDQNSIHLAQIVKHFSDYVSYLEQDEFVGQNWDRLLKMTHWALANYDSNNTGFIENGDTVPDYLTCMIPSEPYNYPHVPHCAHDVVVVSSMEVCELFSVLAAYSGQRGLVASGWLKEQADRRRAAIETSAYDPGADNYYLLYRRPEAKWYHSLQGICEYSRELDVTPYYAAVVSGDFSRAAHVAEYARKVLMDDHIFPMPLHFPQYIWVSHSYVPAFVSVGGCYEESYYNCVRAWSHCRMLTAVYEAIKRRSDATVRDQDCVENYTPMGTPQGRDRYGISAAGHISAIIEGLFGITPAGMGFSEVNIHPNIPLEWAGRPATLRVTLPGNGFLKQVYEIDADRKNVTLTVDTDKQRVGHFRVRVPGSVESVWWNAERIKTQVALQPGEGSFVLVDKPFLNDRLQVKYRGCDAAGLPTPPCRAL